MPLAKALDNALNEMAKTKGEDKQQGEGPYHSAHNAARQTMVIIKLVSQDLRHHKHHEGYGSAC